MMQKKKKYGVYNTETKVFKYGISVSSESEAWTALKKRIKKTVPSKCFVVKEVLF